MTCYKFSHTILFYRGNDQLNMAWYLAFQPFPATTIAWFPYCVALQMMTSCSAHGQNEAVKILHLTILRFQIISVIQWTIRIILSTIMLMLDLVFYLQLSRTLLETHHTEFLMPHSKIQQQNNNRTQHSPTVISQYYTQSIISRTLSSIIQTNCTVWNR